MTKLTSSSARDFRAVSSGLLLAAALAGCVLVPAQPSYYPDGPVVSVAPPAPQAEYYGVSPVVGHIWLGGFWGWNGGRHVWNPGYWSAPRSGHHWVPHAWSQSGRGWRLNPGHWRRH